MRAGDKPRPLDPVCCGVAGSREQSMTDKRPKPHLEPDDTVDVAPSTARPPFDPTNFARESDARIRAAAAAPASSLPTVRPPEGSADILASLKEMRASDAGSIPDVQEVDANGARDALGPEAIPFVAVSTADLAWFDLGPEAARLLAHVNGVSSLEAICATAGITADDAASLLLDLAEQGVVSFR
jgi:hypothetical protein